MPLTTVPRTMSMLLVVVVVVASAHTEEGEWNDVLPFKDQPRRSSGLERPSNYKYAFLDPSLSWEKRIDDLVSRLTLEEIVQQTMTFYGTGTGTVGIPRLGINPYPWITECLRGQVNTDGTAFPQALGLSSAFSSELMFNMSTATSIEVRAHWNDHVKKGIYKVDYGLTCYSPVINIMRHPLWGRNQETYGEDPFLTGTLGQHFVKGLQGTDPRYRRATATCKHFDAYGGPENIPVVRFSFDAKVSKRDWWMTFLPQFKMCVEAGAGGMMCSYNSVNGVPACANKELLGIARKKWDFTGYITSDAGAITNIITRHHYLPNNIETSAAVIKAGCNMELEGTVFNSTLDAVKHGKLTEAEVRQNVKPLFYVRMRQGEFDPPSMNPYYKLTTAEIQSPEHRDLALRAAMMSFVLLKNNNNFLPIKTTGIAKLAVVGPMAQNPDMLFGDYAPIVNKEYTTTPYEGLRGLVAMTSLANGCSDARCEDYNQTAVKSAVTGADLVVVCVGLGKRMESEANDRADLDLPGSQFDLLQDAVYYADGKPVILLLFNAGPLDVTKAIADPRIPAIIECFYPAQSTGEALRRVLTMQGSDPDPMVPAGRLTATWPAYLKQVGPITDYTMKGRTYRYYEGTPMFPFGYGLSYSNFTYVSLSLGSSQVKAGSSVKVLTTVKNLGPYDADEVVQLYMSWFNKSIPAPKLQLVGFQRVTLTNGESRLLQFTIESHQMAVWIDDQVGAVVSPGKMMVYVGGQQPDQRVRVPSNVLEDSFTVI